MSVLSSYGSIDGLLTDAVRPIGSLVDRLGARARSVVGLALLVAAAAPARAIVDRSRLESVAFDAAYALMLVQAAPATGEAIAGSGGRLDFSPIFDWPMRRVRLVSTATGIALAAYGAARLVTGFVSGMPDPESAGYLAAGASLGVPGIVSYVRDRERERVS